MQETRNHLNFVYWIAPLFLSLIFPLNEIITIELNIITSLIVLLILICFYKIIKNKSIINSILLIIPYTILSALGVCLGIIFQFIISPPHGLGGLALPIFTLGSIPVFAIIYFLVFLMKVPVKYVNEKRKSLGKINILIKNLLSSIIVLLSLNIIIFPETYRNLTTYQPGMLFWRLKSFLGNLNIELIIIFFSFLILNYLLEFYFWKNENKKVINKIQTVSFLFFIIFFIFGVVVFKWVMYKDAQMGKYIIEAGMQKTEQTEMYRSPNQRQSISLDPDYRNIQKTRDFLIILTHVAVICMAISFAVFASSRSVVSDRFFS